jgi:hypothetical protein
VASRIIIITFLTSSTQGLQVHKINAFEYVFCTHNTCTHQLRCLLYLAFNVTLPHCPQAIILLRHGKLPTILGPTCFGEIE